MTPLDHTLKALATLQASVDQLAASVINGTPRPYRTPTLTPEIRADRDARARAERHERVNIAPGDSPDPYAFDVTDLLDQTIGLADAIASAVAPAARQAGFTIKGTSWPVPAAPPGATHSLDNPRPYLDYIATWLATAELVEPDLPGKIERKCKQYIAHADALLGHVTDGQTLPALCFVCGGKDDTHPVGGGETLRYRKTHHQHAKTEHCNGECRDYVTCEGGRCEPTGEQSGYRVRGYPAWDLRNESEWFCDRIGVERVSCPTCHTRVFHFGTAPDDYCSHECRIVGQWTEWVAANTCRCGKALPPPTTGRPPAYCGDDCRKAARSEAMRARRAA